MASLTSFKIIIAQETGPWPRLAGIGEGGWPERRLGYQPTKHGSPRFLSKFGWGVFTQAWRLLCNFDDEGTSVLSWYTDVVHGVAPVTSGYRLALSYNLMHSPQYAEFCANGDMAYTRIQRILQIPYSSAELSHGLSALKGEDAHLITNLRSIAEEEGYCVYLGSLQYQITGSADEDYGYSSITSVLSRGLPSCPLIHTIPNTPIPSLPSTNEQSREVQNILRKWENKKYQKTDADKTDMLAYLLKDYLEDALHRGVAGLSARDAHTVMSVQQAAEKVGFLVYLGELEFVKKGFPVETNYLEDRRPRKKARRHYDSDSELGDLSDSGDADDMDLDDFINKMEMEEVLGRRSGSQTWTHSLDVLLSKARTMVSPGFSVVYGPPTLLKQHYRRTVLILLQKEDKEEFLFSKYGMMYALPKLAKDSEPSPELRKLANVVMKKLTPSYSDEFAIEKFAEVAIGWNDLPMWEAICRNIGYDIKKVGVDNYGKAITTFSFKRLRSLLEESLTKATNATEQLALLASMSAQLSPKQADMQAWCRDQNSKLKTPKVR
ncbi:hypothetical protein BDN72DRAFT_880887 [Pluteus cervinus]|uniref:Uncharacterized protein n=1 Tax=Pluteus cervinus TaxID=181527 RepID=A0ACD3AIN3_9AGAR|nr:hypothetical protein BDN72DRAFT_880887 [Pluteus cervinus]